jgi:hypothetical protein
MLAFVLAVLLRPSPVLAGVDLQSFGVTESAPSSSGIGVGPGLMAGLFSSVGTPTAVPYSGVTSWPVTIDVTALGTLPPTLMVNFPDRASVTLTRGRYQNRGAGAFLWTGTGADCSAVFTVAVPVAFFATISCLNANYGITQATASTALELSRYLDDPTGPLAKPLDEPDPSLIASSSSNQALSIPAPTPAPPTNSPPDTTIDILVIYNEATRAHFDPHGGKAATVAFAQSCVDATQQAMDNSTTNWQPGQTPIATVHLAAAEEVAGPSPPVQTIYDYQRYAINDPGPVGLRNLYAADVVVYLVENGINMYGTSDTPGSTPPGPGAPSIPPPGPDYAPYAIAIVQRNTAISDDTGASPKEPFVFPHEFAHLIGANHDIADATNNTTPLTPYAYGYYATHAGEDGGGGRTIMSYYPSSGCASPCTRIQHYSNPNILDPVNSSDDWFHTGSSTANNALLIANYASYTAQYRPSLGRIFYDGFDN